MKHKSELLKTKQKKETVPADILILSLSWLTLKHFW